jgi:hypothetical protein
VRELVQASGAEIRPTDERAALIGGGLVPVLGLVALLGPGGPRPGAAPACPARLGPAPALSVQSKSMEL